MARTVAILGGTGPEGCGLANRLAPGGEHGLIGSRDAQRAQDVAKQLRDQIGGTAEIGGTDNASAAAQCELALLTVPFSGLAALLKPLKTVWKPGTVVIDTTVPLAASVGGAPTRMLGREHRRRVSQPWRSTAGGRRAGRVRRPGLQRRRQG